MPKARLHILRSHRVLLATVATGILAFGAAAAVMIAASDQHHAPEPPLTAAPSTAAGVERTHARAAAKAASPTLPASIPLSISIPAIKVRSPLLQLGRTAAGALDVPPPGSTYNDAGWYKFSPTPGSLGPSVIAGHVDSAADGPSVFYRLGGLRRGDSIRVSRSDGITAIFGVTQVLRFHKSAFPTQLVYGNTADAALRLITCGGPFDSATGHYEDNIVVLASLTGSQPAR